jgi:hypothetical protein
MRAIQVWLRGSEEITVWAEPREEKRREENVRKGELPPRNDTLVCTEANGGDCERTSDTHARNSRKRNILSIKV